MSKDGSSLHHSFDVNLAVKLGGIDLATFYHHIKHWVEYNERANQNFFEGRYWTYQTFQEILGHFPYWTVKQLRLIIDKLLKIEILVKGNFNNDPYDHTTWYSIDYEKVKSMCPNGQIEVSEKTNRGVQKGKTYTHNKPNNNNNVVVVVAREDALSNSPKETLSEEQKFTKDDLYAASIRLRKDWTSQEMEEAWNIFLKTKIPITSPFDYVEGIINKKRSIEEAKNKQPKTYKDSKCNMKTNKIHRQTETKECNRKLMTSNSKTSEKDILTQPLANWKSITSLPK